MPGGRPDHPRGARDEPSAGGLGAEARPCLAKRSTRRHHLLPRGAKVAHQIVNTGEEDLVYLGIGADSPNEVCVYPDSGKVMVRALKTVGVLDKTEYLAGEPERPLILDMVKNAKG